MDSQKFARNRQKMVDDQIVARNIDDKRVVEAMLKVPRHRFVPESYQNYAYTDNPVPIGYEQTISQPYIVALMTKILDLQPGEKVLEIGTGSGYQTAILVEMGCRVFSIEIIEELSKSAQKTLKSLGYENIHFKIGSGYDGWREYAPFNKIIVTAAPPEIPDELIKQLNENGEMIIPTGKEKQKLLLLTKKEGKIEEKTISRVKFVPMERES